MATINRFEDLEVWQLSRKLCSEIYTTITYEKYKSDPKHRIQMLNSSGSIPDNIAEGFGRGNRKEFVTFLGISKGSAEELKSQLYRSIDKAFITEEEFKALFELTDRISKMISGLIKYLNTTLIRGERYKNQVQETIVEYAIEAIDLPTFID